jgi:rare lipoprotein A (peptidoglycan hydrolase)
VIVRPRLALAQRAGAAVVGQPTRLRGHLLPGLAGRRVLLQARHAGHWVTLATARTRRGGAFTFHYVPAVTGAQAVHAAFAGDRLNAPAASRPERISGMQYAEVSWYEDAGDTACGFHATYGIASRTLPCGAKVTLEYGGRSVVATVDDRGPFVYSRLFDLDQTTAAALGMDGVATVLASV